MLIQELIVKRMLDFERDYQRFIYIIITVIYLLWYILSKGIF